MAEVNKRILKNVVAQFFVVCDTITWICKLFDIKVTKQTNSTYGHTETHTHTQTHKIYI